MKRLLLGAVLLLVLVGEPTVGIASGLYTPPGFIVLGTLYVLLFLLYEALREKYSLNNFQMLLINFAVYSVLITGLLHGEIADYVLHPENSLITTLIRIQAACFPLFAYPLVNKFAPNTKKAISLPKVLAWSFAYVLLLTPTKTFGLSKLIETLRVAPNQSCLYIGLAILALVLAYIVRRPVLPHFHSKRFLYASYALVVMGAIPLLHSFIVLVVAMPIVSIVYLSKRPFRFART